MPQPSVRSFLIQLLALMKNLTHKVIGSRVRLEPGKVSYHLKKTAEINDQDFEQLLAGVEGTPAEVAIGTACYEGLTALRRDVLTPAEREEIEMEVLAVSRIYREVLTRAALLSREVPSLDEYPRPGDIEPARWQAAELLSHLKDATESQRSKVVKFSPRLQTWACAEWAAEASVRAASRDLEEAGAWARLAVEVAEYVRGPEGWKNRVKGFAAAHVANVLRVACDFKAAEIALEPAKRLWLTGSDPAQILDPGRLLDLEASLRREQCRFDEALDLLERARSVSRCPARTLISKGVTLESMGEYQRAVEALIEAEPLVDRHSEPRTWYNQRFNLAVSYCHLERYSEAAGLVRSVREVAIDLRDQIFLNRVIWLEGRICAGLGRSAEAYRMLEKARQGFAAWDMWFDVALAEMEIGALLLDEGRTAEVKALIPGLVQVFESRGVHREALTALRLFQEATELETATADLARRVLRFLFRARYDQDLRFSS